MLILNTVDNSSASFINGEVTYRLYAELSDGIITQLNGDENNPVLISTTTTFFNQDLFGTHSNLQSDINTGAFGFVPALQYDTWISLGDSYDSPPVTIGDLGFGANLSGSSWSFGGSVNSDASIFRTPDDPLCLPDENGLVLLGQFTTSGTLSGFINLEGQDGNGNPWVETNIPIPSIDSEVLGCTDPSAINFNSEANTDDGSCEYCEDINSFEDVTACDSYDWNGVTYTEAGTYEFNTLTANGCDSIAILNLSLTGVNQDSLTINVVQNNLCNGNGIIDVIPSCLFSSFYNITLTYPSGATFNQEYDLDTLTLTNMAGGLYTITLISENDTIKRNFQIEESNFNTSILAENISCAGEDDGSIFITTSSLEPLSFEWYYLSTDSMTEDQLISTNIGFEDELFDLPAGEYYIKVTSQSTSCEVVSNVTLLEPAPLTQNNVVFDNICFGDSAGTVSVTISGGTGNHNVWLYDLILFWRIHKA